MKKKILSILLAALMIVSLLPVTALAAESVPVTAIDWLYDDIYYDVYVDTADTRYIFELLESTGGLTYGTTYTYADMYADWTCTLDEEGYPLIKATDATLTVSKDDGGLIHIVATMILNGDTHTITYDEQGAATITSWTALQDAIEKAPGSKDTPATATTTIQLTQDLTAPDGASSITIPEGKDITLDLNGKVLNANGGAFSVIKVEGGGKLTVIDSAPTTEHKGYVDANGLWHLGEKSPLGENETAKTITGGIITGGNVSGNGGGVYVNGTGSFSMSGGNITGNTATTNGGGVCVVNAGGSFTMSGNSKITDNIAKQSGGGVYVTYGSFTMTGGEISNNNAKTGWNNFFGGGVLFAGTTLTLGGTAKITDNTAGSTTETENNLFLPNNYKVTLGADANAPQTGMSVGVTTAKAPTAQAPVQITTNGTADDAKYFTPDNAEYFVNFNNDHLELKKTAYIEDGVLYVDGMGKLGSLDAIQNRDTVTAIVVSATVTGAEANAFAGFGSADVPVTLTLPDGWQGDLPDDLGKWYGGYVELFAFPTAVKNVTFQQRWPWNAYVDITADVTGSGELPVAVNIYSKDGESWVKLTSPAVVGDSTVDLTSDAEASLSFLWNAATDLSETLNEVYVEVVLGAVSGKSEAGKADLRTTIALPEKSVKVEGVTWSDTAWGAAPASTSTDIGWEKTDVTPNTTGKLAEGLTGNDICSVILPSKNGDYKLTHSTGDLTSFVTFTVTGYPSYAITNGTAATGAHGSITLPKDAVVGNDVVVTVAPDNGYALKTLKYNDGTTDYDITKDATTGEYQFTMPAKAVTVTAEFEAAVPIFDACGGTGAVWDSDKKTVSTPTFGDYVFAGWYTAPIGGTKVESNFAVGTTYYAHWQLSATDTKLVLTEGVTVKEDGLYIGETKTDLSAYGLAFTPATTDPVAPAKLTMTNAVIEVQSGEYVTAISAAVPLTIDFKGENTIRVAGIDSTKAVTVYGIQTYNALDLTGDTLNIDIGDVTTPANVTIHGMCADTLTNKATLNVTIGDIACGNVEGLIAVYSFGMSGSGALTNTGTLTAEIGNVNSTKQAGSFGCICNTQGVNAKSIENSGTMSVKLGSMSAEGDSDTVVAIKSFNGATTNSGTMSASVEGAQDIGIGVWGGAIAVTGGTVTSYGSIKANGGNTITAAGATVTGATETFTSGTTTTLTQSGTDPIVITLKPIFDLKISDVEITADNFGSYVKGTTTVGDYTFAGWFFKPVTAEIEFTGTYDKAFIGTYYYAKWKNEAGNTVLTDGIEVKADGVHIGGSETAATEAELAPYGLAFNMETATLTMNGVTIESGDGIRAGTLTVRDNPVYAGIYSELGIELKLTGNNKVSIARNDMKTAPHGGFFGGSLIVTGSGTLTFDANDAKGDILMGLYVSSNLTNTAALTADASGAEGKIVYGIYVNGLLTNSATITGKGGKATNESYGVQVKDLLNTAGTLTGIAGSGAYADGLASIFGKTCSINITGGKVVGYGGTGTDEYYGLWTDGAINVSGSGVLELHGGTKTGSNPVVKEALYLENENGTITISDSGRIVADSAVKNLGSYGATNEGFYTVTGAQTDITGEIGLVLTKTGTEDIVITNKTYTISFNANGGTVSPTSVTVQAYIIPESPEVNRSGYEFAGWYKDAAFTQMWDMEFDYARKDLTLYAKWVKDTAVGNIGGTVLDEGGNPVADTLVRLKRGAAICGEDNTASNGKFKFEGIPAGEYQLVVTKNGNTTTTLVRLIEGVEELEEAITLYTTSKTSSKVEITGNDTPDVMVGGLAEVANARKNGSVSVAVTLEVEKLAENAVDSDDKAKIEDKADSTQTLDYIDMTLLLKVNNIPQDNIADTGEGNLLEVVIPYNLSGRKNIALYRQHGIDPTAVKLPEGEANKTEDGEYVIIDKANNQIRAYLRYFSTYAIGYEAETVDPGIYVPTYAITGADTENGKLTVSPKNASAGQTVTITVTPDKGYKLEMLTVLDKNGKEVEVKNLGNGKFSFTMPNGKVSISATFMEDNTMLNFFVDVKADDYFYDAVLWAAENGITKGTDDVHFSPDMGTTRAQVVTFLWRAAGCPVVNYYMNMSDVKSGEYYTEAVRWALAEGITKGTSATTFDPDAICTRGQIVTFLARFAGVEDADTASAFTDVKSTDFFAAAVKWAKDNGVTEGTSATTFSPNDNCTRAQVVTFLYRWMVK